MKHLLLAGLLACPVFSPAQNHFVYQATFNRIDNDVLEKNFSTALLRLDSIQAQYPFVYARHCIKALQVCVSNQDSIRAVEWLTRCFEQGVPLWIIRTNGLTRPALLYAGTQKILAQYNSLQAVYHARIDHGLAHTIDSLMEIDQQLTKKVNDAFFLTRYTIHYFRWKKNNRKQFEHIRKIIAKKGFPGEKPLGLPGYYADSAASAKNILFYGPHLYDQRAQIMLIHYFSNPRADINALLLENVKNGNLPASHYADFNDFMARWGKGRYGKYVYYNTWHHDPDTTHIPDIDRRRKAIGLNSFEEQERNTRLKRERRKNKTTSSEIILE